MVPTPLAAVARSKAAVDVFRTNEQGTVTRAIWREGRPWSNEIPLRGGFPPGAPLAVTAMEGGERAHIHIFGVAKDGQMWATWSSGSDPKDITSDWWSIGGGFPLGAPIAAVSRKQGIIDVFAVAPDGHVWHSNYTRNANGDKFSGWQDRGGNFPPGAQIVATAREPTVLDVYAIDKAGAVNQIWWSEGGSWSSVKSMGGAFPPGGHLSAAFASRGQEVHVVAADRAGQAFAKEWANNMPSAKTWHTPQGWRNIGGGLASGSPITTVVRRTGPWAIEAFAYAADASIIRSSHMSFPGATLPWSSEASAAAKRWLPIGGVAANTTARMAATSRFTDNVDLWVIGTDNRIWQSWFYGDRWSAWYNLVQPAPLEAPSRTLVWKDLVQNVRQETVDEICGTLIVAAELQTGERIINSFPFPTGKYKYINMPDSQGGRTFSPNLQIFSGNFKALAVSMFLVESDSDAGVDALNKVIPVVVDKAAQTLASMTVVGAPFGDFIGKFAADLAGSVFGRLVILFGGKDDAYNPGQLNLAPDQVGPHEVVVRGRDDGGDDGVFTFKFQLT